jgi:hypothetical protein
LTATFVSRNHAGAYLVLGAFSAATLAIWWLDQAERRLKKSSPAGVFAIAAVVISGGVLFSLSRGAVLTMLPAAIALGCWFLIRRRRQTAQGLANPRVTTAIVAVFGIFALGAIHYLDFSSLADRFDELAAAGSDPSVVFRLQARKAAVSMFHDHWIHGVGAGGFRYLFVNYVRRYPEIYQNGNLFWEHAHCDWLEIPIEFGAVGDGLVAAAAICGLIFFVRRKFWKSAVAIPLMVGCLPGIIHAWFDFPAQCPAISATWCLLVTAAAKWLNIRDGGLRS